MVKGRVRGRVRITVTGACRIKLSWRTTVSDSGCCSIQSIVGTRNLYVFPDPVEMSVSIIAIIL